MMNQDIKKKKKKSLNLPKDPFNGLSQDVKLIKGMPIMSCRNYKKYDIVNNEEYIIHDIDFLGEIIMIKLDIKDKDYIQIAFKDFQTNFYLAYAITTHKSQGSTFDFPYTIHEFELFSNKMKYVALSRSTNISYINIIHDE